LQHRNDCLEGKTDIDEELWKPGGGTNHVLKLDRIALEHGDEKLRREGNFGVGKTMGHPTNHGDHGLPRCLLRIGVIGDFGVGSVEKGLPCGIDIRFITMIGSFIDLQTYVKVGSLIRIVVVELHNV
jgi:hypothetical protein